LNYIYIVQIWFDKIFIYSKEKNIQRNINKDTNKIDNHNKHNYKNRKNNKNGRKLILNIENIIKYKIKNPSEKIIAYDDNITIKEIKETICKNIIQKDGIPKIVPSKLTHIMFHIDKNNCKIYEDTTNDQSNETKLQLDLNFIPFDKEQGKVYKI